MEHASLFREWASHLHMAVNVPYGGEANDRLAQLAMEVQRNPNTAVSTELIEWALSAALGDGPQVIQQSQNLHIFR